MMSSTATPRPEGFRLISFVCETDADLLPHFVRWYRRLGVDRFHFVMHGKWSRENLAMLASLPGVECARWVNKPFCKSLKCDEITAIEGADKVRRVVVDAGGGPLEIVCGAKNFALGDLVLSYLLT